MTLYEIKAEIEPAIEAMFENVDEETGEVSEEAVNRLAELNAAKEEKLDNIGCYIKNLLAEAEAIKKEEENLRSRRKAKEARADRLKDYVASVLGGEKYEGTRVAYSFRKSERVVIPDEEKLDESYLVREVNYVPDKKRIKEAIKNGELVTGAYLETKNNIQIK